MQKGIKIRRTKDFNKDLGDNKKTYTNTYSDIKKVLSESKFFPSFIAKAKMVDFGIFMLTLTIGISYIDLRLNGNFDITNIWTIVGLMTLDLIYIFSLFVYFLVTDFRGVLPHILFMFSVYCPTLNGVEADELEKLSNDDLVNHSNADEYMFNTFFSKDMIKNDVEKRSLILSLTLLLICYFYPVSYWFNVALYYSDNLLIAIYPCLIIVSIIKILFTYAKLITIKLD